MVCAMKFYPLILEVDFSQTTKSRMTRDEQTEPGPSKVSSSKGQTGSPFLGRSLGSPCPHNYCCWPKSRTG